MADEEWLRRRAVTFETCLIISFPETPCSEGGDIRGPERRQLFNKKWRGSPGA